ncbi:DgyrCDS1800 [Dimorphilus gyrociliatus]|nr:DgyrCDS1800 [Dimorphilus gyrociliatus]
MQMVSAAKYAKAERDLKSARPYGQGAKAFYEKAEIISDPQKPKHLLIAMTSDRGLCGAVHSSIAKMIRHDMAAKPSGTETMIVCVGDKSRSILGRLFPKNILLQVTDIGKKPPTFADASRIAEAISQSGYEFDFCQMYYNYFKSVVAYNTSTIPLFNTSTISASDKITVYDSIDQEVLESFNEFSLASLIYYAMKEGACSEQSARMTAMDSASKNAGEMIDKLTLNFNRTRQAVITRELIEIISGAAALK